MNELTRGIQPFWFWNGEMEDEEIRRQIGEMKSQGFTGFFIHPRQGLEIPYLSETYFEKVRTAVEAARNLQMEVWLYDEFPYPSGISGGRVTLEHPEYACTELNKACQVCQGGETARIYGPWGKVLLARAYRMTDGQCQWDDYIDVKEYVGSGYQQDVFQMSGLTKYNKKRYFQGDLSQYLYWKAPEGTWKVYLYTEVVMKHFKYFENFIDPLNPEAVQCFLQTTHEKYKAYVGDEFGKTIRGVFTDEVTAFPPFHPWSALLPGLVRDKSGLDLIEYLPALSEDMGEITDQVRYAYWNAATDQFIQSWDKQVYDWCEENNLLYIGEKPILRSSELEYVHVPGIDAGHQKFGSPAVLAESKYRANGKIVSSAAHFYQKPAVLCEAFHSIGWGMTLQDAKWIFDWLTVMGIDWFVTHGAYYTSDALKKHDAPPSFFYQMPWWKNTKKLAEHVERANHFLSDGKRRVSVLLLDPITSTWTEIDENLKRLNEDFAAFQNKLLKQGVDYYVMDPRLFAKGTVSERDGRVFYENCGDSYDILVLPFMTNLEEEAVRKLQEYTEAGGMTLAAATLPYRNVEGFAYRDWVAGWFGAEPEAACEAYVSGSCRFPGSWHENCYFTSDYREAAQQLARLEESRRPWQIQGVESGRILQVQSLGANGKEQLFLVNTGTERRSVHITIKGRSLSRELAGGESVFLDEGMAFEAPASRVWDIDTREPMEMKVLSQNALRMGRWQMRLADGQTKEVDSFPLIDQMEDAGMKIDICQKDYFGCPKELEFPEQQAEYTYRFTNRTEPGTQVCLVMEPGTLLGEWSLCFNGETFGSEAFARNPVYLPTNLAVDVTRMLRPGENCLTLQIRSDLSFGGIRNPLYLCGSFSVTFDESGSVLEPEKKYGSICDLTGCGLPYFAGTAAFSRKLPDELLADAADGEGEEQMVCIRIKNEDFHDSIRLQLGQESYEACPYAPYEWLVPYGELKRHGEITLCLDTALSRLFEGEYFDETEHRYRDVTE